MAKRRKKKKLKSWVKGLIILLAMIDGTLIFLLLNQKEERFIDNSSDAIGIKMMENGYSIRTATTYSLNNINNGYVSEAELIENTSPYVLKQTYNDEAKIIKEESFVDDACIRIKENQYENHELTRIVIKDGQNQLVQYAYPEYDENTKRTSWTLCDKDDQVIGITEIYSKDNLLEESYTFDLDGNILYNQFYTYDKNHLLKELVTKRDDIELSKQTFTYGKSKRTKESIYESKDGVYRKDVYQYDDNGRLVKVIQYDQTDKELMQNAYSYDVEGLLVKDTNMSNNKYIQLILYKYE